MDMKTHMRILSFCARATACMVLLGGCYSLDVADMRRETASGIAVHGQKGEPQRHVVVANYGWYLFNCIPVVCGNAKPDPFLPWSFFEDQVHETVLQDRLSGYAAALACDVTDLNIFRNEQILLDVYNVPIPIPYLCCYREMLLSAVLAKRPDAAAEAAVAAERRKRELRELLNRLPEEETK